MPKKGSRLITSTVFGQRVSHKPTYRQGNSWSPLSSAVERAEEPGAVLVWDDSGQWGSAFTLTVAEDELAALLGEPPPRPGLLPIPVGTRHACTARLLVGDWPMIVTARAGLQRWLPSGEDSNVTWARTGLSDQEGTRLCTRAWTRRVHSSAHGWRTSAAASQAIDEGISRGIALRPESPGRPGAPGEQRRVVRPGRR